MFGLSGALVVFAAAVGVAPSGCSKRAQLDQARQRAIVNSQREFERAYFYKPSESGLTGSEKTFLPLVVEESRSSNEKHSPPLVYYGTASETIDGEKYDQVLYVWRYAPESVDRKKSVSCGQLRGVRITIDRDGFPMIWEVLSNGTSTRRLFVVTDLEERARAQFGPIDGRFSIERIAAGDAMVVGTLEPGPVPMGPYVYIGAPPQREVTAILCRCSSSQVSKFVEDNQYDLQPIEALEDDCPSMADLLSKSATLDDILHWPKSD